MHVLAVVNRKGGVGKTTTAVNVAAALALSGQRALLVDLDPQGSVGRAVGVEVGDEPGSSVAFRARGALRARYPAAAELFRLGVVPADAALGEEEHGLLGEPRRRERLGRSLEGLRDHWAVVVLDTPPALGGLNDAALRAADAVLVPAAADYLAAEALRGTLEAVRRVEKARGTRFSPLAVLPTFADQRRSGARAAEALLRQTFGQLTLEASIPVSARFDSFALAGVPVVLGAPRSAAARAYREATRELLARLGSRQPARRKAVRGFVRTDMREALQALRRTP